MLPESLKLSFSLPGGSLHVAFAHHFPDPCPYQLQNSLSCLLSSCAVPMASDSGASLKGIMLNRKQGYSAAGNPKFVLALGNPIRFYRINLRADPYA